MTSPISLVLTYLRGSAEDLVTCLTGEHTRVAAVNANGDSSRRVRAVMLFIASIGDEADALVDQLPRGHAFVRSGLSAIARSVDDEPVSHSGGRTHAQVCLEMARLPQAMREIFTATTP